MKSLFAAIAVVALVGVVPAVAQDAQMTEEEALAAWESFVSSLRWSEAGEVGFIGNQAQIDVPDGYVFTSREGTEALMQAFGNPLTDQEFGFIAPARRPDQPDFEWFAVFEFDPVGYVKDDEKAELDPNEMMESLVEGQRVGNERRRELGYDTLDITGWVMEPTYNETTNNLEWALALRSSDGTPVVNLNTRLLGREGVMKVTLVCDPDRLEATIPAYQAMLTSFGYQEGRRYAEFSKGDKIAKYGLTGLVLGGGAAVLAKTGILKKLLKPILLGLAALAAFSRRLFGRRDPTAG